MYYNDLSKYTYGNRRTKYDNHVNIGWLDDKNDYSTGIFPEKIELLKKLKTIRPSNGTKGSHTCQICGKRLGSSEYIIKGDNIYYHTPDSISHYIIEHDYKPPQEFIDAVMKLKSSSSNTTQRSSGRSVRRRKPSTKGIREHSDPLVSGPASDFDMFYNARIVGNIVSSDPSVVTGLKTDIIEDEYFKEPPLLKRKRKRTVKRFKDIIVEEGAGFGHTDYLNVTGDATSSGFLNDTQPLGHNGSSTITSTVARGNSREPSTILVGFKDFNVKDPYFLQLKRKKKKEKEDSLRNKERSKTSDKLNINYIESKLIDK